MSDIVERLKYEACSEGLLQESIYEIESLRAQVTSWKDLYECSSAKNEAVVKVLQDQVAKLTEERDNFYMDYRMKCDEKTKKANEACLNYDRIWHETQEKLTAAEARIAELESALEGSLYKCMGERFDGYRKILSRKSNLDALEAYRDGVIEECVAAGFREGIDDYSVRAIRALKKGTT